MRSSSASSSPRSSSRFWLVHAAVAIAVETPFYVGLLLFGTQGPSDSPSLGWAFYLTQIPGVLVGGLLSRSFPEVSLLGAFLAYAVPFLMQVFVFFVLVSVIRLLLGHDDVA
jgi:hypothetical protein